MDKFALTGSKWGFPSLGAYGGEVTWSFAAGPSSHFSFDAIISDPAYQQIIREAFNTWSAVARIDFLEIADTTASMIRFGWDAIDGASGTIAEAYYVSTSTDQVNFAIASAEIRFDTAENWSNDRNHTGVLANFYTTAVHEIGHAIGLNHVNDPTQIMNPTLNNQLTLGTGDIAGVQTLYGTAISTDSTATQGNDVFILTSNNDNIDGLDGIDTAVFGISRTSIDVTKYLIPQKTQSDVLHLVTEGEGTDSLYNIERLQFTDGILAFDTNAIESYRIYQAAFARTPDTGGLKNWIDQMDNGTPLLEVAGHFSASPEFMGIYGTNPSNALIVTKFYQNVLGRNSEEGGFAFWTGELDSGSRDVKDVLVAFSESPENIELVGAIIDESGGVFY